RGDRGRPAARGEGSCGGYSAGGSLRSPGGDRSPDGRTDHDYRPDLLHPRLTRLPGSGAVPADTALGWPGAGWDRKWTLADDRSGRHRDGGAAAGRLGDTGGGGGPGGGRGDARVTASRMVGPASRLVGGDGSRRGNDRCGVAPRIPPPRAREHEIGRATCRERA